ncbi:S8 family serine peptidase [Cellulomonas palmilytica]|uniref:S8 family serine peptidase n=1 Tax=Cellulomonas palmilytica TaxID=2608402 RepID=UPI001F412E7A|nr:S8 family serine peptidase [Cellulomonas palmilytica]UJP38951.1 S8 family serine peptidase [Cellulomonas palmilytica]
MTTWTRARRAIATVACGGLAATLVGAALAPAATAAGGDGTLPKKEAPAVEKEETLVAGVVYSFKGGLAAAAGSADAVAARASVHASVQSALKASGARVTNGAHAVDAGGTWAVEFATPVPAAQARAAIEALDGVPGISDVEPNYISTADAAAPIVPKDPYVKQYQWNIWDYSSRGTIDGVAWPTGGYSSHATALWPATKGKNVVVAVLDTGRTAHPQLDDVTVAGYDMISNKDRARDGNGRDSNPQDQGDWDDEGPSSWHGTHVAGIVAAKWDGARGVGVAPGVRIQHVRVLGYEGGTSADIAAAITWASGGTVSGTSKNKTPAKVINLSLGGKHECGAMTQRAIDNARKRGAVIVVSAGNSATSASLYGPANCKNVITVAALDEYGQRASYSNYGKDVEIGAPGGEYASGYRMILSTLNTGTTRPATQTWGTNMGTSQAAPHVSAAAAMLTSLGLKGSAVESAVKKATSPFPNYPNYPEYNCTTSKCGAGYLNLQKVLAPAGDVTISGTAKVGSTVTAKYNFAGKVNGYKFQWYRDGKAISGATGKTRTLTSNDKGKVIKVRVVPVGTGSYVSISKYSAGTKVG